MNATTKIKSQIERHPVLVYMKGTPQAPRCGFSAQTVSILMECGKPFAYVDVLAHAEIRRELPQYARWPTFPQLWIDGELVGGCDIVTQMHERGELLPMVQSAVETGAARQTEE